MISIPDFLIWGGFDSGAQFGEPAACFVVSFSAFCFHDYSIHPNCFKRAYRPLPVFSSFFLL